MENYIQWATTKLPLKYDRIKLIKTKLVNKESPCKKLTTNLLLTQLKLTHILMRRLQRGKQNSRDIGSFLGADGLKNWGHGGFEQRSLGHVIIWVGIWREEMEGKVLERMGGVTRVRVETGRFARWDGGNRSTGRGCGGMENVLCSLMFQDGRLGCFKLFVHHTPDTTRRGIIKHRLRLL